MLRIAMDEAFHYPPELFDLLVEAIPRLVRSKNDVLVFFRGAGASVTILSDLQSSLTTNPETTNKFRIARTVLQRINEVGDSGLQIRREVIRRVTEIEDFSACWPNDRLAAEGLVAKIRHIVGVKDSFTRMSQEREAERRKHMAVAEAEAAEKRRKLDEIEAIRRDLCALYGEINPQVRGKSLEGVLNRLFASEGISVREAFTVRDSGGGGVVEQVDGVIHSDGHLYFVEMKWWKEPVDVPALCQHMYRVFSRAEGRALVVSASGFTRPAIVQAKNALAQKIVVLAELREIVRLLENQGNIQEWLSVKTAEAAINGNPYFDAAGK